MKVVENVSIISITKKDMDKCAIDKNIKAVANSDGIHSDIGDGEEEKERSWMQILTIFIACISTMTYGCHFSWPSPSIPKLLSSEEYNITSDEASYFTVISSFAFILSTMASSYYNEKIGRKRILLLIAVPHLLAWILISTATSVYVFYIARFLAGTAEGVVYNTSPMYIGEIASPKVRGTYGNVFSWVIYLGELMINVIGSYCSVRDTALILMPMPIIFAVAFSFMPESPYFHLMQKKEDEARKSLQMLKRKKNVEKELNIIKNAIERQMIESAGWKDLIFVESNRKALICGIYLRVSQLFSGLAAGLMYTQLFFKVSIISPEMSAILTSAAFTILNAFSCLLVDLISRKKMYMSSLLICGICLLIDSAYDYLDQSQLDLINLESFNWVPLVAMTIYCVSAAFGVAVLPNLLLSELFATTIKPKALCIVNIIFAALILLSGKIFYDMNSYIGLYSPLLLFGCCCFVSSVIAYYIIPDTNGKTLEEIQQMLKGSKNVSNSYTLNNLDSVKSVS